MIKKNIELFTVRATIFLTVVSALSFLFLEQHTRFEGFVVGTIAMIALFTYEIWKKTVHDVKDEEDDDD